LIKFIDGLPKDWVAKTTINIKIDGLIIRSKIKKKKKVNKVKQILRIYFKCVKKYYKKLTYNKKFPI
jgi:hypothetical protein